MHLLAATDFSTRSNRAVRQAGLLAQSRDATLFLVHVADEDQAPEIVKMEMREAEQILAEQIKTMPELAGVECRPMVVSGNPFDGILRTAAAIEADLIVMGAHRKQFLRDIFVGTTIERVIRTGPFPVLMVNNEAQRRYTKVLAAVDFSEHSANAVRAAHATGLTSEASATFLHAFMAPAKGKMFIANIDQPSIDKYVEDARRQAMDELAAFIVTNKLDHHGWSLRLEEGGAVEALSRVVKEVRPDLLIMGTHGRSSLLRVLIGSVTEEALRSLSVDILAVPPARR
jgi:universal stress protein E